MQSHRWVTTSPPESKLATSAPIIRTLIARLPGKFNPSCDRKSHNVTWKVTPQKRVVKKSSARFSKRVGPNSTQQKSTPKGVTNETNKYPHPCRGRSLELHGYHRVGSQPPLPQM